MNYLDRFTSRHLYLTVGAIMALFIGYISQYVDDFDVAANSAASYLAVSYLLLLLAALAKKSGLREQLLMLAAIAGIYPALPQDYKLLNIFGSLPKEYGKYYWFWLVTAVLLLFVFWLFISHLVTHFEKVSKAVQDLIDSIRERHLVAILFGLVLIVQAAFAVINFVNSFPAPGSGVDSAYATLLLLIRYATLELLLVTSAAFFYPVFVRWFETMKEWYRVLGDYSISTYLTRKITGVFYAIAFFMVTVAFALAGPSMTIEFTGIGDTLERHLGQLAYLVAFPFLLIVLIPFWFLALLAIRLVLEAAIALVHVAENTKR